MDQSRRALSRPLCDGSTHSTAYGVPKLLNLGREIFLSHSGKDKEFVRFLQEKLCEGYHDSVAFFDEDTLPKAEPVSMQNILEEARGSKLGVLVLTDDFFTHTPNPMRELLAFVAGEVQLLPLFFTISVDEFKEKSRRASWEERWREWSAVDEGVINEWSNALDLVNTFSGLEYCKTTTSHCDFIHKIVNTVTGIIRPAISFSEEGVFGRDRLCKIVNDMYEKCAAMRSSNDLTQIASTCANSGIGEGGNGHTLDVVGIYGLAGMGKSTLCKCLCDFYFREFNGKVCHVDLGSIPADQASSRTDSSNAFFMRMQYMLSLLTCYKNDGHYSQHFSLDQVKNLLRKQFSLMKNPVFLAIDNILRDWESLEEADFYLNCSFPKGSKVFITSRSRDILHILTSQYSSFAVVINYIPSLELQEARDIFVYGIPELRNFGMQNVENDVNECVKMCTISWNEYHPLMLKSLAGAIRWDRRQNVDAWKGRLKKLRSEGIADKNDAWKRVFNVLDISYGVLSEEAKTLFLDLALFCNATRRGGRMYKWIQSVYLHFNEEKLDEILLQLQDLCFIEYHKGFMASLLLDFANYKVSQGINPHFYVVVEDAAHRPDYDPPRTARNVSILRCAGYLRTLDLRNMEDLEVLHLVGNSGLQEVLLSRTTSAHLRSLIVTVPPGASLSFIMDEDWSTSGTSRVQRSCHGGPLQWLELEGNIILTTQRSERSWLSSSKKVAQSLMPSIQNSFLMRYIYLGSITPAPAVFDLGSILGDLRNLKTLRLSNSPSVQSIDLTTCTNLKALELDKLPSLRFICGHDKSPNLVSLRISECEELLALTIPADGSRFTDISHCRSLGKITICTTSSDPETCCGTRRGISPWLNVRDCPTLRNIDGLLQYTGHFSCDRCHDEVFKEFRPAYLAEAFGELLLSSGFDLSLCIGKASFKRLYYSGVQSGLAGLGDLDIVDVQNTGLLISALLQEAQSLQDLGISCKEDGDCGCDKNAPRFIRSYLKRLRFCCPQVRDLASLEQCHNLTSLSLSGCTSVELWPDFGTMTRLEKLDLSYTSLKEWPAGVLLLPSLHNLYIRGCEQLSAEEFIKGLLAEGRCEERGIESLIDDIRAQRRDRCSVVDALHSYRPELEALFQQANFQRACCVVKLMHHLWFEGSRTSSTDCEGLPHNATRTKMRSLLCSPGFLSLAFCKCKLYDLDNATRTSLLCSLGFLSPALYKWQLYDLDKYIYAKSHDDGEDSGMYKVVCGLMAVVLVGEASCRGWYNDDVKESMVTYVKWFSDGNLYDILHKMLLGSVGAAVCKIERVPNVAAELGHDFMYTIIQALEAKVIMDLQPVEEYLYRLFQMSIHNNQ